MSISHEKSPTLKDKTTTYATLDISRFLWFLPPMLVSSPPSSGCEWVNRVSLLEETSMSFCQESIPHGKDFQHQVLSAVLGYIIWTFFVPCIGKDSSAGFAAVARKGVSLSPNRAAKYFTTLVAVKACSKRQAKNLFNCFPTIGCFVGGPTDGESY